MSCQLLTLLLSLTSARRSWRWEKGGGGTSTDSRVHDREDSSEQANGKAAGGDSSWVLVEIIALIVPWLTSKSTVAKVGAVERDYWSRKKATVNLQESAELCAKSPGKRAVFACRLLTGDLNKKNLDFFSRITGFIELVLQSYVSIVILTCELHLVRLSMYSLYLLVLNQSSPCLA